MYQPTIKCRSCFERIRPDAQYWTYGLCDQCMHQCVICRCLVDNTYQCNTCGKYACYAHTNMRLAKFNCYLCMPSEGVECFKCEQPIVIGYEFKYWYCPSCVPACALKCGGLAISGQQTCDHHNLMHANRTRSIFHSSVNENHVPVIVAVILYLGRGGWRLPRPIIMAIIKSAFSR